MNLMDIKESLEPENIKQIMLSYGVEPYQENSKYFVYPTVCHNHSHGSNKLYYYFDSKLFVCYTECDESFNIFGMIQKLEHLRGNDINVFEAAEKIGFGSASFRKKTIEEVLSEQTSRFIQHTLLRNPAPDIVYDEVDQDVLKNFPFNFELVQPWINEGMTVEALQHFSIGYSIRDMAIVIPHRSVDGKLIGVRGRFMSSEAPNKYMPLSVNGKLLTHSIRGNLYGLYENQENIKRTGRVIIYESEKSVILHSSYFGQDNNISVATCGNKISNEQTQLLLKSGAQEVILAFDQDFENTSERDVLFSKYSEIAERLSTYFSVSIIMDWETNNGKKESPIDNGPTHFNNLYMNRSFI